MAKKSMILKQQASLRNSPPASYNRCKLCGRPHAYLRDYGVCRICFRDAGLQGRDPRRPQRLPGNLLPHASLARLGVHKVRHRLAAPSGKILPGELRQRAALRRTHA